jgi:hypothetical protein
MPSPGEPPGTEQAQAEGQEQGAAQEPMPGPTSPVAAAGGISEKGQPTNNQIAPPGELQLQPDPKGDSRTADDKQETDIKLKTFQQEPWFAKLPPALQKALLGRSRTRAPRGYEERLRRYFESID